jgi:hypothetical protein
MNLGYVIFLAASITVLAMVLTLFFWKKYKFHQHQQLEKRDVEFCEHAWERDGQTMTAIRYYCPKCKKSKLVS